MKKNWLHKTAAYAVTLCMLFVMTIPTQFAYGADPTGTTELGPDSLSDGSVTIDTSCDTENPWVYDETMSTDRGMTVYKAGNAGKAGTVSNIKLTVKGSGVLSFDYWIADGEVLYNDKPYYRVGAPISMENKGISILGEINWTTGTWGDGSSLESKLGQWCTYSIPVDAMDEQETAIYLAYINETAGNGEICALSNVRFNNTKASLNYKISDTDAGTVTALNGEKPLRNGEQVSFGSTIMLKANVNDNYKFYGWVDEDGTLLSESLSYTFTFNGAATFKAVIEKEGKYVAKSGKKFYESIEAAFSDPQASDTVILISDMELKSDLTIPKSKTLLLPYKEGSTAETEIGTAATASPRVSWINPEKYLYRTLTIGNDVTLTVDGSLVVGAVQHFPDQSAQGHTSGAYAQIENSGTITVNGTAKAYGLIKGTGKMIANTTSEIYEPFIVNDYAGGTNTLNLYNAGQFPFGQYALVNIQNTFEVHGGAKVIGIASIFAKVFFGEAKVNIQNINVIGGSSNPVSDGDDGELILLDDGAILTKEYDAGKCLGQVGNINLADSGKTTITIKGGATIGKFDLKGYGSNIGYLNIPYNFDFVLEDGRYTMPEGYKYRIMPGASITVKEDAALDVKGALLSYDGLTDETGKSLKFYPNSQTLKAAEFSTSGNLIIDGKLNIADQATFGGIVQTTNHTGMIAVGKDVELTNAGVQYGSTGGYTNNLIKSDIPARIYDGTGLIQMKADKMYCADGAAVWTLEKYTLQTTVDKILTEKTYDIKQGMQGKWSLAKYNVRFFNGDKQIGETQSVVHGADATEPEAPKKDANGQYHYIFKGWDKAVTDIRSDVDLYAEYTEEAHTIVTESGKAATCTEAGITDASHCSVCNKVLSTHTEIPAKGHHLVWKHDGENHWQECSEGDQKTVAEKHTFKDNICTICGYTMSFGGGGAPVLPGEKDNVTIDKNDDNEIIVKVQPEVAVDESGQGKVSITEKTAEKLVESIIKNKGETVVIEVPKQVDKPSTIKTSFPKKLAKEILSKTNAELEIKTPDANVAFDQKALNRISTDVKSDTVTLFVELVKQPSNIIQKIIGDTGVAINLSISNLNAGTMDFRQGRATVSIPIPTALADKKVKAVHIAEDGVINVKHGKDVTIGGVRCYQFETDHFSTFALVEDSSGRIAKGVKNTKITVSSTIKKRKITIKWKKSPGFKMDYYEVYRSTKRNSGYGMKPYYQTKNGSKTIYTNTKGLKKGIRYYYKVRGVRLVDGVKVYTKYSNKAYRTVK